MTFEFNFEDMRVGQLEWQFDGEDSDWQIMAEHATFSHREAPEFILHIGMVHGTESDSQETWLEHWKSLGLSAVVIEAIRAAQKKGYEFLCFYS